LHTHDSGPGGGVSTGKQSGKWVFLLHRFDRAAMESLCQPLSATSTEQQICPPAHAWCKLFLLDGDWVHQTGPNTFCVLFFVQVLSAYPFHLSPLPYAQLCRRDKGCVMHRDAEVQSRTLVQTLNPRTEPKVQVQFSSGSPSPSSFVTLAPQWTSTPAPIPSPPAHRPHVPVLRSAS